MGEITFDKLQWKQNVDYRYCDREALALGIEDHRFVVV